MPSPPVTAAAAGTWKLADRTVHRMGFGSMRITANPDRELALTVLRRAVELGVNHIDTAAFYFSPGGTLRVGSGPTRYATELIREALWPYPEDLVIATKVGPGYDPVTGAFMQALTPAALRAQVEENLRRLGRDHLDVVNLRILKKPGHDSVAERFGVLAELRDAGLIRHLGLSNIRADHLDEAAAIAPVVCVQNSYGLDNNRQDDALLRICGERGIAFVPFFAIAGARREDGAGSDHDAALWDVAHAHGVTPHQVRLAWTLHQGPHVLAIPGTGDPDHLVDNIAAGALRLSPAEVARLDSLVVEDAAAPADGRQVDPAHRARTE
ncbi:aldo/keto reductase [Phytohabitans houttuyneae]|uniref:Oxidoreductase n=1 Tax=Phytohabitans houttuyneae TaxID=1076126 RepID=A0A6V8KBW7_9ACTN|nr:aldo/keto reductase [Phytohabitans houttuyneae]GFJ79629.1 oxidoreductase [Phytohabitans houttuyneae]